MKNLSSVALVWCFTHRKVTEAQGYTVISTEPSTIPASQTVEVSCEFTNQWTAERHPLAYPPGARWLGLVLASHSLDYTMWADGELASPTIQAVAEVGLLLLSV